MYELIFYEDKNGKSPVRDYLDDLKKKSEKSKDARINREKILSYMAALMEYGTRIGEPFVKHIDGQLWELRPLRNRIFFFYWKDDKFVLVHHCIKRTRKTPAKEKDRAMRNMKNYMERNRD